MIRFSCSDYTFPLLERAKRFELLRLLGFEYVDIGLFERNAGIKPSELIARPAAFTRQLKHDLEYAGMQVSDIFLQTGVDPAVSAANDSSKRVCSRNHKTFLLALDLCSALGCRHLTGLPGVWHEESKHDSDFALAVEEACWREQAAFCATVDYAIEPHIGSLCGDIASTRRLLDSVPGLTLTLDYGHFVSAGIDSYAVHSLLPLASHIHARGASPGRLQTPVNNNDIDFAGMFRDLHKQKYRGFVAIEYVWTEWMECNRTDNISETILLRRWLEDLGN
jgi:sugar phosphate isomerase/epimerase